MRSYADPCGIARALDVVGDRWAILIVRELLHGPKRFGELRTGLGKVSAEMLGQRLRDLEGHGVVVHDGDYALTGRGRELAPVLRALGRWGSVMPFPDGHGPLTPDAFATALETLYAGGVPEPVVVEVGETAFTVADGVATRGRTDAAAGLAGPLPAVLWHGEDPQALTVTGDRVVARRFLRAFPLPA